MPALDPLRRRLSLTERQLEYLRLHSNGEAAPERDAGQRADRDALAAAGLITAAGTVHPLVADLAIAMSRPVLELWVESASPQGRAVGHVVVRADEDLWYADPWPGASVEDEVVFAKDELPRLLQVLARLVGHRRSTPPGSARPVTAPWHPVTAIEAAMSAGAGGWEDARTVAIADLDELFGPMSSAQRELWIAVLATLEGTWRATCAWGPQTRHTRGLAVWDCGAGGFWLHSAPPGSVAAPDRAPDAEVTLVPISGGDLWKALAELLPSKAELAEAAELAGRYSPGDEVP